MKRFSIIALVMLLALGGSVMSFAQDTATPEPTIEATVEPTVESTDPTAEPTVEATAEPVPAMVRVAHWSPDAPAVDVFVNGEVAITGATYPSLTSYMSMEAGTYSIAVVLAGAPIEEAVIGPVDVELVEGAYVTIAAVGSAANGTLTAVVAADDFSAIPFGSARILAYHAIEGAPNLDFVVGDTLAVTELGFPGTFTDLSGSMNDGAFAADVPAGTYDISIRVTEGSAVEGVATPDAASTPETTEDTTGEDMEMTPGLIDLPGYILEAGNVYTIAVIGSVDAPTTFITSQAGFAAAQPSALDVALSSPDFSILAAAVAAADPSIAAALSGADALTVFAPTNAAFDALLNDMAMTPDDLFANTELLNAVLLYHVVSGANNAEAITALNGQTLTSLQGEPISITVTETGGVVLNGTVNVTSADIGTSNGVVHVIDAVLLPPSIANAG